MPSLPENTDIPQADIHEIFEIRVATTPSEECDAYSVRWQVYCQELGYEPSERFPDRQEYDEADERSVQAVVYYRPTGHPIGCFRLLLANPERMNDLFHIERVCPEIRRNAIPPLGSRRLGYVELSRYCILHHYRRYAPHPPPGIELDRWSNESIIRRGLPALMWFAAASIAVYMRIDYVLALMEPRLSQLARWWGFVFEPIGNEVSFRGVRRPYRIDRRSIRALLSTPATTILLRLATMRWQEQARQHPLVMNYIRIHTERMSRQ